MGHWSSHFTGHVNDMHGAQQNQPCIIYQPQLHTGVPGLRNGFTPELQINSIQPRHPLPNLDLNFPPPAVHYTPYLDPPSCAGDFPIQVPHGPLDVIGCFPVSSHSRNIPYMDDMRGACKRKSAEGTHGTYQYHNANAGPSSSIAPINAPETGSYGIIRSQPCVIGAESFLVHNANQFMLGSYVAPSIQIPGNHWLNMDYRVSNDAMWRPAPLHYVPAGEYVARLDPTNVGFQGFQRSPHVLVHPPPPQLGHPNSHQPPVNMLIPRDARATDLASSGFQLHRPQGSTLNSNASLHAFPQMRFLPEDETAILDVPGYHEPSVHVDQHHDMRLDIDHMSYEELLALEEQIGIVVTGLPEKFIQNNLKTRNFIPLSEPIDQQIDFCVICQSSYKEETGDIAILKCDHEYHSECLKKWLVIKNTCPICKSTALSTNKNL